MRCSCCFTGRIRHIGFMADGALQPRPSLGKWGIVFCLFMNGRFHFGQRFNLREEAIAAASQAREALASDGWA
jgi:hypothetical protein